MNKNLLQFFSNKKVKICSVLLVICVIFLIAIKVNGTTNKSTQSKISESQTTLDSYEKDIEKRIVDMVSSISGVSNVKCMVYTKSSIEIEYFVEKTSDKRSEEIKKSEVLSFQKNGSSTEPVIIKKVYPKIVGILVVADGVENEKTRLSIINALASVFDINIASIEVLRGS